MTCSGTITSAFQLALDATVDGDTVTIGSGNCTAGQVDFANVNITIQGAGVGITNITGLRIIAFSPTKAAFRITGMTINTPIDSWKIDAYTRSTAPTDRWRIDHVAFNYSGCAQNIAIWIYGLSWGLIDHAAFSGAGNGIFISSYVENSTEVNPWPPDGTPGQGGTSWSLPLNLGSDEAVYIEDSTFTMPTGCYLGVSDSFYGGRRVFRYNTVTNLYWQNHAARGFERGGSVVNEVYNNDFNATDAAWSRAIHIRSGTGVVFNNTLRGFFNTMNVDNQRSNGQNTDSPFGACDGTSSWDGNTSGQSGWPCLDQIGRGSGTSFPNQPSVPLYVWNNGSASGCHTGGSCANDITMTSDGDSHVASGRDYFNNGTTAKPGYTAYTYPHPLQGGGAVAPTVTTTSVTSVTATTASSGGNVTSDGGATVTARGVCRSTSSNPTTSDTCTSDGTGTGSFSSSLSGMTASTVYHVRAFATNSAGTSYGSDVSFTTATAVSGRIGGKATIGGKAVIKN